ncbi:substrate-binding periplasmic protein [Hahella ganghwensis]|uniref:substrate-binding periplasmic protein n=1 Tax=Hahella ganghwensis TaxID=286420 RepID=UPI0003664913|nr:transporter substrate-binding domain-containing protein [Hahella ganghwensis]
MKKHIIFSVLVIVPFLPFSNAAELKFNTQEFPPFSMIEHDQPSGVGVELVQEICLNAGIACKINIMDWSKAQQEAREKRVDGLFVIGWNLERGKWLRYTLPIIYTEYGFFVKSGNNRVYSTVSNFSNHLVGVFGPSNTSKSLGIVQGAIPSMRISLKQDDIESFSDLINGKVDAVYSNRDVGWMIAKNLRATPKVRYAWSHKGLNYYVGFVKGKADRSLVKRFNFSLKKLYSSGEAQIILQRYNVSSPPGS